MQWLCVEKKRQDARDEAMEKGTGKGVDVEGDVLLFVEFGGGKEGKGWMEGREWMGEREAQRRVRRNLCC